MAINYLNSIDLNQNELIHGTIENQASDALAGTPVEGQLYFNTTSQILKVGRDDGTGTMEWVEVGGGVETLSTTDGTYINLTPNTASTGDVVVTADLSAADGTASATARFLTKDNTWAVPAFDDYSSWSLQGDSGTAQTVSSGETVDIAGGLKITTDIAANRTLNVVHDLQAQTDTTSTASPTYGGTFTTVDSVTRDSTGHVTGINVKTVTLPASDDTTYDLSSAANATAGVDVILTGSDASTDAVNIVGTANEVEVAQTATANKVQIGLPDDVTITNELTVGQDLVVVNDATFGQGADMGNNRITLVADPTQAQDAATKAYVDAATVGGLVYQGGYDANTNTPVLDSRGTQIAVEKGWTYTVTADGTFYGEVVRIGDVIIAEVDLAAGNGALTDWTTVQNNIDLASATQVGIGNVAPSTDSNLEGIDVSYANPTTGTATVGLDIQGLTGDDGTGDPISNFEIPFYSAPDDQNFKITIAQLVALASSNNTATGTITAGSLSGTVTHAFGVNTIVQTIDSSGNTVYCDISRTATTSVATISAVQATDITILVQKIG